MGSTGLLHLICLVIALVSVSLVQAEDAYKYFTWTVTYGTLYPLASPQQVCKCNQSVFVGSKISLELWFWPFWCFFFLKVILINGQFPGPRLDLVTNENVILNLINKLDEPFLLTWYGSIFYVSLAWLKSVCFMFCIDSLLYIHQLLFSFYGFSFVRLKLKGICGL